MTEFDDDIREILRDSDSYVLVFVEEDEDGLFIQPTWNGIWHQSVLPSAIASAVSEFMKHANPERELHALALFLRDFHSALYEYLQNDVGETPETAPELEVVEGDVDE